MNEECKSYLILIITRMLTIRSLSKPLQILRPRFSISTKKSPYQTLNLKQTATPQQIKKSFREAAQKYHPDKNPNNEQAQKLFMQAKQAYETLIDEDKRRQYDSEHGIGKGRTGYGFQKDPFDQFNSDMYRDKSRVYAEATTGPARMRKGDDIQRDIKISFLDSVKGVTYKMELQRKDTCKACHGNKCQPGTAPTRCLSCGGSGTTFYRQMSMTIHTFCSRCNGHGVIIKNPCHQCKATGVNVAKVEESIEIPAGVTDGESITFKEKGNHSENGPSGDLHIRVAVEKHPVFRRNQNNIETTEWITISQAALGTTRTVDTIWSKKDVIVNPGTQDGSKSKIRGQGIKKGILDQGDHICIFRIKIPISLTPKQKQIFQELAREEKSSEQSSKNESEEGRQRQQDETGNTFKKFKDMFK